MRSHLCSIFLFHLESYINTLFSAPSLASQERAFTSIITVCHSFDVCWLTMTGLQHCSLLSRLDCARCCNFNNYKVMTYFWINNFLLFSLQLNPTAGEFSKPFKFHREGGLVGDWIVYSEQLNYIASCLATMGLDRYRHNLRQVNSSAKLIT